MKKPLIFVATVLVLAACAVLGVVRANPTAISSVSQLIFGQYNLAGETLSDGQTSAVQLDSSGHLLIASGSPLQVTSSTVGAQVQASASCAAAAACAATLPGVAGKTTYIESFCVTSGPPAAVETGVSTVAGPAVTLNFDVTEAVASGAQLCVSFPNPVAASAANTAITVTLPVITGGAVSAVSAVGVQQ